MSDHEPSTADPAEVRLPEDPSMVNVDPDEALAPGAGESPGGDVEPGGGAGDQDGMTGA